MQERGGGEIKQKRERKRRIGETERLKAEKGRAKEVG